MAMKKFLIILIVIVVLIVGGGVALLSSVNSLLVKAVKGQAAVREDVLADAMAAAGVDKEG